MAMAYYTSEIFNDMIHEVEKAFPLETPVFPTSSIRDLIEIPTIRMMKGENVVNHF